MTVAMGKQYVYSQHQSMVCTLWLALPQQRIGRQWRNLAWAAASDSQLDDCPCFPLPVYAPQFEHLVCRQYSLAPGQLLLCDTLSRWDKRWFWLALDSNLRSDSPESSFFFKHIFFPFLGELEAHSAPFPGSTPCPSSGQWFPNIHRTQARPTPCQQVPLVAGICTIEVPLALR